MSAFNKSETRDAVIDIVAQELKADKSVIGDEATLESLGADSLDIVQIIMKLEEQFGIEISDTDAQEMHSLADIVDYVNEHRTK